jgi:hypothetical protein
MSEQVESVSGSSHKKTSRRHSQKRHILDSPNEESEDTDSKRDPTTKERKRMATVKLNKSTDHICSGKTEKRSSDEHASDSPGRIHARQRKHNILSKDKQSSGSPILFRKLLKTSDPSMFSNLRLCSFCLFVHFD